MHVGSGFFMNNQNDNRMQLIRFSGTLYQETCHSASFTHPKRRRRRRRTSKIQEFALTVEVI